MANKDVIYLDPDDEITGIIDKVDASKEKVVALVLPKRATSLQSIVNMRLLRRSADNAGKNVVLITKEEALLPLAGAAGLHAAETLSSKPKIPPSPRPGTPAPATKEDLPAGEEPDPDNDTAKLDYHRSVGALAAVALAKDEDEAEPEEIDMDDGDKKADKKDQKTPKAAKEPKTEKVKVPNFDQFRTRMIMFAGLGVLLIALLFMAKFVFPKATITITTSSTPVSANFTANTSGTAKSLDETGKVIPSSVKTSDFTSSQSVPATGQQNNGDKASGSVVMSMCISSPSQLTSVPAGTGVSTNGVTFITQQTATLSFAGACGSNFKFQSGNVSITAQQAGAKYNVDSASFSVQGYSSVSASGSASGGTDNIQTIVSQADLDTAKNKVSSSDTDTFSKNFQSDLTSKGLYTIPSTFKAADPVITSTPAVGQPGSTVSVTIKITYSALVVQKTDLEKIITNELNKQIKQGEQKLSSTDVVKAADISVQSQSSPTDAVLAIDIQSTAVPILNETQIKTNAVGKKAGDITNSINAIPGVKDVKVDMSPFYVSKAPKASKITVVQLQVKSGS